MAISLQTKLLKVIVKSLQLWILKVQQEKVFEKNPKEYLLSMETGLPVYMLDIMDSCARRKVRLWAVGMIIPAATLIWM